MTEEVRIAVPFEMTEAECVFFEVYVNWRRCHPLTDQISPAIIAPASRLIIIFV